MVEAYTDEELLELRQPYLDRIEEIWRSFDTDYEGLYIQTPIGIMLVVHPDGEVYTSKNIRSAIEEYLLLYPQLERARPQSIYLAKTDKLKEHLIELILNRESKVAWTRYPND